MDQDRRRDDDRYDSSAARDRRLVMLPFRGHRRMWAPLANALIKDHTVIVR